MRRPSVAPAIDDFLDDMPARGGARAGVDGLRNLTVMREVAIDSIQRNAEQPRRSIDRSKLEELKDSIRVVGLLTPINLWQLDEDSYLIVAGERRWTAFTELAAEAPDADRNPNPSQFVAIPAVITDLRRVGALPPHDAAFVRSTVENIQREDLNPSDLAAAYAKLKVLCGSDEKVAEMTGKSLRNITQYLAVAKAPSVVTAALDQGDVTLGEAEVLARARPSEEQAQGAVQLLKGARGQAGAPRSDKTRVTRALAGQPVVGPPPGPTGSYTVKADGEDMHIPTVRPAAMPLLSSVMRRSEVSRDAWANALQEACELTNVWPTRPPD
ncbi:MAG: ParB/RepB/Spo0J family partition protein [Candidatus Dormibacteria bacterium]